MKYLITLISFIFLLACTKVGKNVTIKGRVLNPVTGEGIQDAEVKILKTAGGFNGGFKAIKTVKSNSDGSFEISKLSLENCFAVCHTPLDVDYYQIGWENKSSVPLYNAVTISVKKGKTMHADYYAVPYGCALWHVKNVNCESTVDTMWYKIKYQYDSDFLNIWSFPYIGCSDALSSYCDKIKMGKHILLLKISRPSGLVYKYDTLFVNENGVTNYNLFY